MEYVRFRLRLRAAARRQLQLIEAVALADHGGDEAELYLAQLRAAAYG